MENFEFELKNKDYYREKYKTKFGFNVSVRVYKSYYNLVTLGIKIYFNKKIAENQKCYITFKKNDDFACIKYEIPQNENKQQCEFFANLGLLKQILQNPNKIICRIEVIDTQEQLPLEEPNEQEKKIKKVLDEVLECAVCLRLMTTGKLYLCGNGHSVVCEVCFPKLNYLICPICQAALTQIRNYSLEQVRDTLLPSDVNNNPNGRNCNTELRNNGNNIAGMRLNAIGVNGDDNFGIDTTHNIGHILLKGIKKIFDWFADYKNWNQNDRRKNLMPFFFILEVYVLLAVVLLAIAICHAQIHFTLYDLTFTVMVVVFVLNLSPPRRYHHFFFEAQHPAVH